MQYESPEGMQAFAEHSLNILAYTWTSGDTSQLEKISDKDCSWCSENIRKTKARTENGEWIAKLDINLKGVGQAAQDPDDPHRWRLTIQYSQTPFEHFDGSALHTYRGVEDAMSIEAMFTDQGWILLNAGDPQ